MLDDMRDTVCCDDVEVPEHPDAAIAIEDSDVVSRNSELAGEALAPNRVATCSGGRRDGRRARRPGPDREATHLVGSHAAVRRQSPDRIGGAELVPARLDEREHRLRRAKCAPAGTRCHATEPERVVVPGPLRKTVRTRPSSETSETWAPSVTAIASPRGDQATSSAASGASLRTMPDVSETSRSPSSVNATCFPSGAQLSAAAGGPGPCATKRFRGAPLTPISPMPCVSVRANVYARRLPSGDHAMRPIDVAVARTLPWTTSSADCSVWLGRTKASRPSTDQAGDCAASPGGPRKRRRTGQRRDFEPVVDIDERETAQVRPTTQHRLPQRRRSLDFRRRAPLEAGASSSPCRRRSRRCADRRAKGPACTRRPGRTSIGRARAPTREPSRPARHRSARSRSRAATRARGSSPPLQRR